MNHTAVQHRLAEPALQRPPGRRGGDQRRALRHLGLPGAHGDRRRGGLPGEPGAARRGADDGRRQAQPGSLQRPPQDAGGGADDDRGGRRDGASEPRRGGPVRPRASRARSRSNWAPATTPRSTASSASSRWWTGAHHPLHRRHLVGRLAPVLLPGFLDPLLDLEVPALPADRHRLSDRVCIRPLALAAGALPLGKPSRLRRRDPGLPHLAVPGPDGRVADDFNPVTGVVGDLEPAAARTSCRRRRTGLDRRPPARRSAGARAGSRNVLPLPLRNLLVRRR